jgi:PAS domain S-box-containing protein
MSVLATPPLHDPRFRACFANAAVAIAITDLSGTLIDVNPAFCRISGYTMEEIVGGGFSAFHEGQANDEFVRLVNGEIPGYVVERRYPRRDGSTVWARSSVSLMHDEQGKPLYVVAIIEDWTEKKKLEEVARQSHKMEALGRLAGGVAHDFNNLLMIINSYASLLKEDFGADTPAGGRAQAIEEAGTRAAVLTKQLLAFSRKQVLQTQVIGIDELIRSSEQMLRRLIRENIEFVTELAASDGYIDADLGQIQQVLMNLAVNASDAMPNGGRLMICTGRAEIEAGAENHNGNGNGKFKAGSYVVLSVADTGIGMDRATVEQIFEPFFTTKRQGKGTGLGLATVYGIIEQSGGHIQVESELGRGTTFTIYLPAMVRESLRSAAEPATVWAGKQIRATVLLAEDEEILRRCLLNALSSMGCFVLQARDGEHALEIAKRQLLLIDVVITDMVMPRMGGRELVNSLRALRPKLPVIFMSGYTDVGPTKEELRSGATIYFQKPFSTDGLRKAVEEILTGLPARSSHG